MATEEVVDGDVPLAREFEPAFFFMSVSSADKLVAGIELTVLTNRRNSTSQSRSDGRRNKLSQQMHPRGTRR